MLPGNSGYSVCHQHVTLDPAAATIASTATTWETSYCWKIAVLCVRLCNISW